MGTGDFGFNFNPLGIVFGVLILVAGVLGSWLTGSAGFAVAGAIAGLLMAASLRVANQWQKAVILRMGKFSRLAGPGPFFVIPVVEGVAQWIDHRIMTTSFNAEQTLTKDTVPVDVDAVLFWMVYDAEKAALEVADYRRSVSWAAQTALRDVIGRTLLADMLAGREKIDQELREMIDERTEPWGVTVQSVEIRDVVIPRELQDAMSREAQAERERRARIILGTAETEIANKFREAAAVYADNPTALHLRAMNMLYEGLKEKGALVVVPSTAVETMGLGTMGGLLGLRATFEAGLAKDTGRPSQGTAEGEEKRKQ